MRAARLALPVLLLAALFLRLTPPVGDPDAWWHLAMGRSAWEGRSLLPADPFVPPDLAAEAAAAEPFATTQSWLAQLILHGAHALAGLAGVVILRAAILTLLWALLWRLMRRSLVPVPLAALLCWLSVGAVAGDLGYIGERPQLWSSLLLVALVSLLEAAREGSARARLALPVLMLLWANLHGGFILGALAVLPYLAAFLWRGDRRSALACAAALLAAGVNPNGFAIVGSYLAVRLRDASALLVAAEEQSLLGHAGLAGIPRLMPHLATLAVIGTAALLADLRDLARRRPELLALALLLAGLGAAGIRFLVFPLTVGAWIAGRSLRAAGARLRLGERLAALVPPRIAAVAPTLLAAAAVLSTAASWAAAGVRTSALLPGRTPPHPYAAAADRLEADGARGTVLAVFDAGGYLAWRLAPRCRVLVHGGAPTPTGIALYRAIVDQPLTPVAPLPDGTDATLYRRELRDRGIDLVVVPGADPVSGTLIQLAAALVHDAEWALVHADRRALVFERITAVNGARILRTMQSKERAFEQMAEIARQVARTQHGRSFPAWRYSLAYALYGLGRPAEALPLLEEYLRLVPADEASRAVRDRIVRELRSGRG